MARGISYEHIQGITILDFRANANGPRLLLYPSIQVADNNYVFLSFQMPKEEVVKYVFELTPEGYVSRSCRMD